MTGLTWVRGKLRLKRAKPEPEPAKPQPQPARQLADFLRRCPTCQRLRAKPGENPGLLAGACMCAANAESLADRPNGLRF